MSEMDLSPRTTADGTAVGRKRKRNVFPIIVLALVLVAGGFIVTQFLSSAVDYFCNVDEVDVRDGCDSDSRLRLQGTVDEGTVERDAGRTMFTMSYGSATVPVSYDGDPGGIFKECIPVVVHGKFDVDGTFLGDRVEVKHSDEYQAKNADNLAAAETAAEDAGCAPVEV
jgi:cytochrome c-type biogenesis protein CcmE